MFATYRVRPRSITARCSSCSPCTSRTSPPRPALTPSAPPSASEAGAASRREDVAGSVVSLATYRSRPRSITARCSSCPPSTSRISPPRPAQTPSALRSASAPGAVSPRAPVAGPVGSLATCRSRACATWVPSSSRPPRNAAGPPCPSRARPTYRGAGRTSATGDWDRSSTGSLRLGEGCCRFRRRSRAG
ncbi:unnamed protein product [Ectocarpus sp. 12 AP-2014]